MRVKITKLANIDNPLKPSGFPVGFTRIGKSYGKPVVGECFHIGGFRTSTVQEILDDNDFKTHNSIYKWEEFEEDYPKWYSLINSHYESDKNDLIADVEDGMYQGEAEKLFFVKENTDTWPNYETILKIFTDVYR